MTTATHLQTEATGPRVWKSSV